MSDSKLFSGKRGLIMGVANDKSIAWGMAQALYEQGAEIAYTYQGDAFKKRVENLVEPYGSSIIMPCDVSNDEDIAAVFETLKSEWGSIDFIIHAVAYSNKEELKGRYVDTTLENFLNTMHISCYSFTSVMRYAEPLMENGGSAVTLSYYGAQKVMPNYNVMGVAKAALEASTRYLAADLGQKNIRVNAISAGPMRTLAGSAIGSARKIYKYSELASALHRSVKLKEIGGTGVYLLSELSGAVTGEVHYVDCGFNAVGMCPSEYWDELVA